jgi:hypothetical protein
MSRFNVNTSHPLIPNSQEYTFYYKYVIIHSIDRDINKYPNSSEFEIELPQDLTNIVGASLNAWAFPETDVYSVLQKNVVFSFKISRPYNPIGNYDPTKPGYGLQVEIFNALLSNIDNDFVITIEDGFYTQKLIPIELTNKMNEAVTFFIVTYLVSKGEIEYLNEFLKPDSEGRVGYNEFIVVYNDVSTQLWFGNSSSKFIITNSNEKVYGSNTVSTLTNCISNSLPEYSYWGLPAYLGFERTDAVSIGVNHSFLRIFIPRFYYLPGNQGEWLKPNLNLPGSDVYYLQAPNKSNLNGPAYFYLDIKELNCIDELDPYVLNNYTLTNNTSSGRVNSSFARVSVGTNVNSTSPWYSQANNPYKLFVPPLERLRKLNVRVREHNGQLVNFYNHEFSFIIQFTVYSPQIERKYNIYDPNIVNR